MDEEHKSSPPIADAKRRAAWSMANSTDLEVESPF